MKYFKDQNDNVHLVSDKASSGSKKVLTEISKKEYEELQKQMVTLIFG